MKKRKGLHWSPFSFFSIVQSCWLNLKPHGLRLSLKKSMGVFMLPSDFAIEILTVNRPKNEGLFQ